MYIKDEDNEEEIIRIRNIILEIVRYIRLENNYEKAAATLLENNIGVLDVARYTLRLSLLDIAVLSDNMLALK